MPLTGQERDKNYLGEFLPFSFSIKIAESCKTESAAVYPLSILPSSLLTETRFYSDWQCAQTKEHTYFLVSFAIISSQWKVSWGFWEGCPYPLSPSTWNMNVINGIPAAILLAWGSLEGGIHELKLEEQKDWRRLRAWWPWSCHLANLQTSCHTTEKPAFNYLLQLSIQMSVASSKSNFKRYNIH